METSFKILKESGYEVLKVTNSSHRFPVHFHKKICIGKIDSGEKYLCINNQTIKLTRGDVFIIPPFTFHSCYTKDSPVSYTIFSFDDFNEQTIHFEIKNEIVKYLVDFVDENCANQITLDEASKKLGYDKFYLSHLFKKIMGIPLHQYIIQIRIKKAKEQGKNNELPEIALQNGFYDESHFIKSFKKYEGITPKKYYDSLP